MRKQIRPAIRHRFYGPLRKPEEPKPIVDPIVIPPKPKPKPYIPIADVEGYIRSLFYHNNIKTEAEAEAIRKKNYVRPPIVHSLSSVRVKMFIRNGTKIKIQIIVPFEEARPYFKMGKIPPIEVQMRCLRLNRESELKLKAKFEEYNQSKNKKKFVMDPVFNFKIKPVRKIRLHPCPSVQ